MYEVHYFFRFDLDRYEEVKATLSEAQLDSMETIKSKWDEIWNSEINLVRISFVRDEDQALNPREAVILDLKEKGVVEIAAFSSVGPLGFAEDDVRKPYVVID